MRGELKTHDDVTAAATHVDEALAALGLVPDRPVERAPEEFHLWPECLPVFDLWLAVQTQWRMGMQGPTGLDYAGVEAVMRHGPRLPPRRRRERFELLRAMERTALDHWPRGR